MSGLFRNWSRRDLLVAAAALACSVLLFFGGPGSDPPRWLSRAWNLGHVLCFLLWGRLLFLLWPRSAGWSFARQLSFVLLFSLIAGALVEVLQGLIGRTRELADVGRDLLGGALAGVFWAPGRFSLRPRSRRLLQGAVLAVLLLCAWPLLRAVADETIARLQFPVLSSFNTPFEAERWSGRAARTVDPDRQALRLDLGTGKYSGVSLRKFPGDWRGYRSLVLQLHLPGAAPLAITVRIHDRRHRANGSPYDDRFNRTFTLHPGDNRLVIDLAEVAAAPKGRTMDLARISKMGLFATRLPQPAVLYLDEVRLEH